MRTSIVVLAVLSGLAGCGPSAELEPVATSTCASGQQWMGGNAGSSLMNPGQACIACHTSGGKGPRFAIAGTVYADLTQATDCGGVSTGMKVEITDAKGAVTTLTPNAAGNFTLEGALALPYRAKLIHPGGERVMASAQTNGDCNACHTGAGSEGAPGRVAP